MIMGLFSSDAAEALEEIRSAGHDGWVTWKDGMPSVPDGQQDGGR